MKWNEIKELLDNEFPPMSAISEDYIGEQVKIKNEISKIMISLDLTLDVIAQAQKENIDLLVVHHPLFFGSKEELLNKDNFLKSKYNLLKKLEIGVYVIHTNADFNPNSISHTQAILLEFDEIIPSENNGHVLASYDSPITIFEFIKKMKDVFELRNVEFRSNFDIEISHKHFLFASGAGGKEINYNNLNIINIIGEVKHHEWVMAMERNVKIIEISHFSEKIFKNLVKVFLEKIKEIEIFLSEEENGYKIY